MINGFVCFDRIRSQEEFNKLVELAHQDNHGVFAPTHALRRNGELVGYFSVGSPGVPIVFGWLSTKQLHARDSFYLINSVEDMVARTGAVAVAFPIPECSPFFNLMTEMGYKKAEQYTFFIKEFK